MQESVSKNKCTFRCNRKDSVVHSRLGLGHCGLRSGKHPDGKCECGDSETVKHVLLQCKIYSKQRKTLFRKLGTDGETVFNMHTLLNLDSWVKTKKLMDYLHKTGVYKRI